MDWNSVAIAVIALAHVSMWLHIRHWKKSYQEERSEKERLKAALERADKGLMHSKQLKVSEALVPLVTKAHRLQINDQAMRYWVMHQYTLWHPGAQEDVLNHAFEDAVRRVNGK